VKPMGIETYFNDLLQSIIALLPNISVALVVLAIGYIVGRLLGKGISKILTKTKFDEALRKTIIGKTIEHAGVTGVRLFDLITRWAVYFVAIFIAVDILSISELSALMQGIVAYIPYLIAGVLIITIGFIISDFVGDVAKSFGKETKIEYAGLFSGILKLFLYFIVIIIALSTMKIDVSIIYTFATALAWGIALGLCIGLGIALGLGFKDVIAENAEKWIVTSQSMAKKAEDFWRWYSRSEKEKSD